MQKEQGREHDSYLNTLTAFSQKAERSANFLLFCSKKKKKKKKSERKLLLNCIKGLVCPGIRLTVVFCFSLNSWLLFFILCSPLYFEPWKQSLNTSVNWNQLTSALSLSKLQTRAWISNLTTDFCSCFLLARVSTAGGGRHWLEPVRLALWLEVSPKGWSSVSRTGR